MKTRESFMYEPWAVTEAEYNPAELERNASLFFLGNGYLGLRGGMEEKISAEKTSGKGTFINGFFESGPQTYGESAYGFPDKKQALLNLPDPTGFRIFLDDEEFCLESGCLTEYSRSLSLRDGLLYRKLCWTSPGGRKIRLEITRCVSMVRKHIAVIRCRISDIESTGVLRIVSECSMEPVNHAGDKSDPRTGAGFKHSPLQCLERRVERDRAVILQKTRNSGISFAEAVSNSHCSGLRALEPLVYDDKIEFCYEGRPSDAGETCFTIDKFICYYSSIENDPLTLIDKAAAEIDSAEHDGAKLIVDEHIEQVNKFWESADIEIEGDNLQQGIRFNLFSIYQSAGADGFRNIAAKGLSGEGYEGHYFWDTEIYVIPFFSYTFPEIAAKLLEYRYNILDHARARASVMSEKGALFPWRTINGDEASAYFPAGTAQYHINADIAYGITKYNNVSGDDEFLKKYGLEILIETARLWISLGFFDEQTKSFRINCVTGPDEYTAIVNNNYFTNIMARKNLLEAAEAVNTVRDSSPDDYARVVDKTSLQDGELQLWLKAASEMYLPYNDKHCVSAQDDSFFSKEVWDFSDPKLNRHPLLLNLHPLVIYRYQILKQPDVVLANFLLGEEFSRIQKMRDYDYYNPITTGDSSLAPCIQSIMAAELGRIEDAYGYFMKTARMDLDDINSNVCDGIHIAAMGGTWLSLIYGFAGLRDSFDELSFFPRLPGAWDSLKFKLKYRGHTLAVNIGHDKAEYSLEPGEPSGEMHAGSKSLRIKHMGTELTLRAGDPVEISMIPDLKAVIFDLDGVITDTSEYHYQAWNRLAEEEGYTFSREINEKLRGISRIASLDIMLESSGVTLEDAEKELQAARKNEYYKELLHNISPSNMLPGISDFLAALKEHGIKTALASASRNAPTVVEKLGIAADFDIIMDAAAVAKGKPDPEIFVTAAERLGLFPEQCAGVEDAAAGVVSIRNAGMFSVGIGEAACKADYPLDSTSELDLSLLVRKFKG